MGWNNVKLSMMALLGAYSVHRVFDTAFDWFILMGAAVVVARVLPDEEVRTAIRFFTAHVRNRVDYSTWFTRRS